MHRWEALRQKLADRRGTRLEPVLDEVTEALAEVLRRHSSVAMTVIVEDPQAQVAVRLAWFGGRLTVNRIDPPVESEAAGADLPSPVNGANPAPPPPDIAARLAELIRRDPSLLEDLDDRDDG